MADISSPYKKMRTLQGFTTENGADDFAAKYGGRVIQEMGRNRWLVLGGQLNGNVHGSQFSYKVKADRLKILTRSFKIPREDLLGEYARKIGRAPRRPSVGGVAPEFKDFTGWGI